MTLKSKRKSFLPLLLATAGVLYLFSGCSDLSESETRQVKAALQDSLVSTTESWDMTLSIIENGDKIVELEGTHAVTISEKDTSFTRIQGPIKVQVYDSTGNITTHVKSKRAVYYSQLAEFELFGNVKVNTTDRKRLRSDYLKWSQQKNRISTPYFVTITTPKDSISGSGFTGTLDLSDYSIEDPTGRVTIEQEADTTQ